MHLQPERSSEKREILSIVTISSSIGLNMRHETWDEREGRGAMHVDEVKDQISFLAFLAAMRSDFAEGALAWESAKLGSFLEAMEAWAAGSCESTQVNPWRHAADLLHAGAFYE